MPKQTLFWIGWAIILIGLSQFSEGIFSWVILLSGIGIPLFIFSMSPRIGFFVRSIQKTSSGNVLLTFDDGPDPEKTPVILEILKRHGAKAQFFLIGKKISGQEHLVRQMVEEGHLIGSHSYNHTPWIGFFGKSRAKDEIWQAHKALLDLEPEAGRWFRPPFGVTNPHIASALNELNLRSVAWSVRSFDTVRKNPDKLAKKLIDQIKGSDIVLLHDTKAVTLEALEPLIVGLKKKNLTLKAELEC